MLRKAKQHLTYANVMASLAVFAVLGGGMAVAAGLKKNSVKSKQIASNAVKSAELAPGAVATDKLADNAATGAKVDEATLGTVPSAATADKAGTADTATSATTAQDAQSAQTAQIAANAQNAALAANSTQFGGKTVAQVRDVMAGDSTTVNDPLLNNQFEQVDGLTADVGVPAGGGDLAVVATLELQNTGGAQAAPICRLESDQDPISANTMITSPVGPHQTITLVGFANNQGAGTENVTVECNGDSVANDDVLFLNGDLQAEVSPIG